MNRRTFVDLSIRTSGIALIPGGGLSLVDTFTIAPPKFSMTDIEKVIRAFFKPELLGKNKFSWDGDLTKSMGLDSLDAVELVLYCEEAFNTFILDVVAESIRTPRQLANLLFEGLNNAIVFYEKSNFEGEQKLFFTKKGVTGKIQVGKTDSRTDYACFPVPGSVYKPKDYTITLNGVAMGKPNKKYEDKNFAEFATKAMKGQKKAVEMIFEVV